MAHAVTTIPRTVQLQIRIYQIKLKNSVIEKFIRVHSTSNKRGDVRMKVAVSSVRVKIVAMEKQ